MRPTRLFLVLTTVALAQGSDPVFLGRQFNATTGPDQQADQAFIERAMKEKPFTAPTFINENHAWIDREGRLMILLPNPNADGWDPSGTILLDYEISILDGCTPIFSTNVQQSRYPLIFEVDFEFNLDQYTIGVTRYIFEFKSKETSAGIVIVGPQPFQPVISSEFLEINRWLLHIPKVAGGFQGTAVFTNRFPQIPARIWIAGFDSQGMVIEQTRVPIVVSGLRAETPIYGSNGLLAAEFQDQVSHIGLHEEDGKNLVSVAITYKNVDESSLTATIDEVNLLAGDAVGSVFSMEARQSAEYWDGIAVLNLTNLNPIPVDVIFRNLADGSEIARTQIGELTPGSKLLRVISDLAPFQPNGFYTIESAQGTPFQVVGLRGSNATPPLLVGSNVSKNF